MTNDWGSGFQADVTITNNGSPINGWDLTWSFPGGQSVSQMWNAEFVGSGASNLSWNASIGTGASVSFGFLGSPGGGSEPTAFSLNGTACAVV